MALVTTQRGETFAGYNELATKVCPTCGVLYAAPTRLFDARDEDGECWYCPNGHSVVFTTPKGKRDEQARLERQLQREREHSARMAAQRDQAQADARAQKAAKTRIKNDRDRIKTRVANGVCPHCNRTFQNLARHMASQHPDCQHND
jgi:hypothetical protein